MNQDSSPVSTYLRRRAATLNRGLIAALTSAVGFALSAITPITFLACAETPVVRQANSEYPQRIVAVAPSVTETLFALGLGTRVVAVGDYSSWPPEVDSKPRVGGLFDPRLEELVALQPDLAIVVPSEEKLASYLRRLGIEVLVVSHETLLDVESSITVIARRTGVEEAGRQLVAQMQQDLEARSPRASEPRRVLFVVAREAGRIGQLTAVGSGTFLAELADRLGVINVFSDIEHPYPQVSMEAVLARRPEAIVELQPRELSADGASALLADWYQFDQIPAVVSGCLRIVGGGHVLLPGPRMARVLGEIEQAMATCQVGS